MDEASMVSKSDKITAIYCLLWWWWVTSHATARAIKHRYAGHKKRPHEEAFFIIMVQPSKLFANENDTFRDSHTLEP